VYGTEEEARAQARAVDTFKKEISKFVPQLKPPSFFTIVAFSKK
jgi:hypothetical protein